MLPVPDPARQIGDAQDLWKIFACQRPQPEPPKPTYRRAFFVGLAAALLAAYVLFQIGFFLTPS